MIEGGSFDPHPLKMREMRFSKAVAHESPAYSTKENCISIPSLYLLRLAIAFVLFNIQKIPEIAH